MGFIQNIINNYRREKLVSILVERLQELQSSHPSLYEDLARRWNNGEIDGIEGLVNELNTIRSNW